MGKASSKVDPQIEKFSNYSHHGQLMDPKGGAYYYYKLKSDNDSFIAKMIEIEHFETLKNKMSLYKEIQARYGSFTLNYIGEDPDLPIF